MKTIELSRNSWIFTLWNLFSFEKIDDWKKGYITRNYTSCSLIEALFGKFIVAIIICGVSFILSLVLGYFLVIMSYGWYLGVNGYYIYEDSSLFMIGFTLFAAICGGFVFLLLTGLITLLNSFFHNKIKFTSGYNEFIQLKESLSEKFCAKLSLKDERQSFKPEYGDTTPIDPIVDSDGGEYK